MTLYLILILIANVIIDVLNIAFSNGKYEWWVIILLTMGFTIFAIVYDGIQAAIIRKMPPKWFNKDKTFFDVSKKELKFYEKIGIRKWKEKVPELGHFTNFRKNKIVNPHSSEYIDRFILETCYGIVIHYINFPLSFLMILLDFKMYSGQSTIWLTIILPVAFVNAFLNTIPCFILRYNLPKLKLLYKHNLRIEKRKVEKASQ